MVDQSVLDILNKIMAIWGIMLIICSVFFNALAFVICIRSKTLRKNNTFKLLAVGAINDILMCFTWNFDDFMGIFFNFQAFYANLFYCEFFENFLQYITITFASWLLVSISLDRVLTLYLKKWNTHYFCGARPFVYTFLLALLIALINIVAVFKTGYSFQNGTDTEVVVCFEDNTQSNVIYNLINKVL